MAADAADARPRPAASALYYADAPNRLMALLLDAALLTVAIFLAAAAVSVLAGPAVELDSGADTIEEAVTIDRDIATLDAVISLLIGAVYFAGSWRWLSATPGQRLLGLQVGREEEGSPLSILAAAIRWGLVAGPFSILALVTTVAPDLNKTVPDLVVALWYVALLVSVIRSPSKQGIHDHLVRSAVAKRASPLAWETAGTDAR